ncbi:MAG: GTPase [Candidatus Bathyarchaeota archaeon]|nr:GTPase [Candidatus Bathyarchaeota archaeon]
MTNLPPQAKEKWNEVTLTRNPEERLRLMGEFLSIVPKHKGTDRMVSQVKKQMATLREEIEKKKRMPKPGSAPTYFVPKAGAAQVAVVGPTNVGRSSLLRAVTNAQVEVTPYPYGTKTPVPGMLPYRDIQFQLVEVPALVEGSSEGRADGFMKLSMARNADGIIIVVDVRDDPAGNFLMIARELANSRILIAKPEGEVEIEKRAGTQIQFLWEGELSGCSTEDVIALLGEYKIRSALVRVRGRATLETVEDAIFGNAVYRPTLVLANKSDLRPDPRTIEQLRMAAEPLEVVVASADHTPDLAATLGERLFRLLDITRVYTKEPGKEPARTPMVYRGPVTVGELARTIHNDFYRNFKYARVWGPAAKFPNEKVGLDRRLTDGTIVQLYT